MRQEVGGVCCSQEAHTLCVKSESSTQSGKSACDTSSRDRCDDRAGLGGEQTAWGGTARSGGLCSSTCAASLREGRPQSRVPSQLPPSGVCWPQATPSCSSSRPGLLGSRLGLHVLASVATVPVCLPSRSTLLPAPSAHPSVAPSTALPLSCLSLQGPCLLWATALTA